MDFVRWIRPEWWSKRKQRWASLAFKKSSGDEGGASVVEHPCAIKASGSIEQHALTFYPKQIGPRVMFWRFDSADLPNDAEIVRERSLSGDDCHHDIRKTSDEKLNDLIYKVKIDGVTIVDGGVERSVTLSDIDQDAKS